MNYCQEVKRSPCPIACTLDLLGDRWTLLIIRDLYLGKSLFKEFLASPEKIATNILSARLSKLCEEGLVERQGQAYRLSQKGRTVLPLLEAVRRWGLEHLPGTGDFLSGSSASHQP
ncbi:helix-turn-helix transcriptional regulator [bacterium]|nr:helix-turn-helix transcriptional regulator [bacterium]